MSVYSIYPLSLIGAIPDLDWECPQTPPPPAPPEAPPLPIFEQTPVKTCFFDLENNMLARPPPSLIDLEEEAEFKAGLLEEMAPMRLEAANKPPSPPPREPKFVMFRTMNIEFLDPSGLVSSPESVAMEWEPTTPVDTGRVVPDSQEDPFAFCFAVPDSTADSEEDLDRTG
ncbi:hypothetical protein ACHAPZ_007567 [Fusarium culmorum]